MAQTYRKGNRLFLQLTSYEKQKLKTIRDTDDKPYRRERAAILLKVASGQSPHSVAKKGLLKERDPDTIYTLIHAFAKEGFSALTHKARKKKA